MCNVKTLLRELDVGHGKIRVEKLTVTSEEKRIAVYSHMTHMSTNKLTNQFIFTLLVRKSQEPGSSRWKAMCKK